MSLSADGDVIYIKGHCRVEDAETLLALLQKSRSLATCEGLHAAVVQASWPSSVRSSERRRTVSYDGC